MNHVRETVNGIAAKIDEVLGVILLDKDGIPVAWSGGLFDMEPDDLGAVLAASYTCYAALGEDFGQFRTESIMVEYDNVKLVHYQMPSGSLVMVAEKTAPLGVMRLEAKRGIQELTRVMESTSEARRRLMRNMKFRKTQCREDSGQDQSNLISLLERQG
ncbi:roadblock/LC7 domain-containing protein [Thermodesulfobacteriota bacterium]